MSLKHYIYSKIFDPLEQQKPLFILKKEKKGYYLNWYFADKKSSKLENMVASNLYRTCLTLTDMGYGKSNLFYLRTG